MSRRHVVLGLLLLSAPALAAETLVVDQRGQGEQRVLRVGTTAPKRHAATFSMDLATTSQLAGQQVAIDVPVVSAGLDVEASPAASGTYALKFAYTDVTVAGTSDAMGKMVAGPMADTIRGVHGTMTVRSDGEVVSHDVALGASDGAPQGSDEGLDPSLWFPRLPTEPVGVGAVWTVTEEETDARGFAWTTRTTHRLVALDADRATIAMETERRAGAGKMKVQGMTVDVAGIVTKGTGTAVVTLDQPFPEAGAWTLQVDMTMTLLGRPTTQTTKMDLRLGRPH